MNRYVSDKLQVSTVTDKQASADKLLDKPKKFCWSHVPFQTWWKVIKLQVHSFTGENTPVKKPKGGGGTPPGQLELKEVH